MKTKWKIVFCLILSMGLPSKGIGDEEMHEVLKRNPFEIPVRDQSVSINTLDERLDERRQAEMVLKATLVSGAASIANIDGSMVMLGEKYNGYELIEVREGSITLLRNDMKMELKVSDIY